MSARREQLAVALRTPRAWGAAGTGRRWASGSTRSTALRWRRREASGEPLVSAAGRDVRPLSADGLQRGAYALVREHARPHRGRRATSQCARTHPPSGRRNQDGGLPPSSERERRAGAEHVTIAAPGILRGFDAMELCPPRWTSATPSSPPTAACPTGRPGRSRLRYDGACGRRTPGERLREPTELRSCCAWTAPRAHVVPAVQRSPATTTECSPCTARRLRALLRAARTTEPRAPRSGWAPPPERDDLDNMMAALNATLAAQYTRLAARRQEVWRQAARARCGPEELAEDVRRARRALASKRSMSTPTPQDLAWRLAVKQALVNRGLLRVEKGGWC